MADGEETMSKMDKLLAAGAAAREANQGAAAPKKAKAKAPQVPRPEKKKKKARSSAGPTQPHLMKPQFYTFPKKDAVHPSGEAVEACALMWLRADAVAVGYFTAGPDNKGEVVAFELA